MKDVGHISLSNLLSAWSGIIGLPMPVADAEADIRLLLRWDSQDRLEDLGRVFGRKR